MKRILAIDFETANASRSSACSIGYALIENGEIIKNEEVLINPEEYFDPFNISIHGITEEMVEGKPTFPEAWEKYIKPLISQDTVIIAHNAGFDMSVLRHTCDKYNMQYPQFKYLCTRILSKNYYENLNSYALSVVAEHLGIEFEHHKSNEDALVCAKIYLDIESKYKDLELDEFCKELRVRIGIMTSNEYKACETKHHKISSHDIKEIKADNEDKFDETHIFFNKQVVFTGTLCMPRKEAMQHVVNIGGKVADSVTKKTNFLILGVQDLRQLNGKKKSSKIIKAESLIEKGQDLEIIDEDEFLRLI